MTTWMRARWAAVAAVTALVLAPHARAEPATGFEPGEGISLELRYLGMQAGVMQLSVGRQVVDGVETWPLTMTLETRGLAERLFGIRETFRSYFVPATGTTLGHDLDMTQDGKPETERMRYVGGKVRMHRERPGAVFDYERDVTPGALDGLAAVYRIRTLPLGSEPFSVPIFTGNHEWTLEGRVAGRERVETDLGEFDAIVVRARTHFTGKFSSDRELTIWLTDDARRLPLRIDAGFAVGSIKARIKGWTSGELAAK
jgi:hypothetical protein